MTAGDLAGRRVTVMGVGRFGGGTGAIRWLAAQGCDVLATDLECAGALAEPLRAIDDLVQSGAVRLALGGHNVAHFTDTDLVVASPAVPKPWDNRFLRSAGAAGVPITTEIRLLAERLPNRNRVIGVTGSAGKSTTTSLIARILSGLVPSATARGVVVGGNLGGSLLLELDRITPETWVVLELSSAQLHWLGLDPAWSPGVGVMTNIAPNHLDWHGTMDHYIASKLVLADADQVVAMAGEGDALHSALAHKGVRSLVLLDPSRPAADPFALPDRIPLRLVGAHNQRNARLAIIAALVALGVDKSDHATISRAVAAAATLDALPHRLRLVASLPGGVRCFDDSKATTPEASLLAIQALAEEVGASRIHLIAGGYDKGVDLSPLAARFKDLGGAYTIGATAGALQERSDGRAIPCTTLADAVATASSRARAGDVILLSPGCASWDQFENYEQRGREFLRALVDAGASPSSP